MSDPHMYDPEKYMESLISLLKARFGERLIYVGLQGSYERGEATPDSDIDPMVFIKNLTSADLGAYRQIIKSLDRPDKSCGFLADSDTVSNWNALEIFSLVQSTRDYFGCLSAIVPAYTQSDIRAYALMSANNLLHEITHRFVHAAPEKSAAKLGGLEKGLCFTLQHVVYLEKGIFPKTRSALSNTLCEDDRLLYETVTNIRNGADLPFDAAFGIVFDTLNRLIRRL